MPSSPPSPPDIAQMPDSAFGLNFTAFLDLMRPEEKSRVIILTLKLLAHVRISSLNDEPMLRAAALLELHLSGNLGAAASVPTPRHVSYGTPPP